MLFILNVDEEVEAVLTNDSPKGCPYWNDKHTERLEDSLSTYEFECPADHPSAEAVRAENFVAREDLDGNTILFKIKNVVEDSQDGQYIKRVYAENAAISELNTDIIRPKNLSGVSAPVALDYMLQGTQWTRGQVDYLGSANVTMQNYETALAGLHMLPKQFGGELRYRITLRSGRIDKRYIDLLERRGEDTGKRFEYAKDIKGVKRIEDSTDLATAIIPIGKADSKGVRMTIATVNNNRDYVEDLDARNRWSPSAKHLFGVLIDESAQNPTDLKARGEKELARRKNPRFTYEVDVVLLERKAGISHEDVRLGDGVDVLDLSFEPYLALGARIIEVIRSYTDPLADKVTLGEFVKQYISLPSIVKQMQSQIIITAGKAEAAEVVYKGTTPPDDTSILWLDMSNTSLFVWKKYDDNSSTWIPATPTSASQVGAETPTGAQSKADAAKNTAISTAASDATTKANNAQTAAINTAAADATTKANNAQQAAIDYTKTNAEVVITKSSTAPSSPTTNQLWLDTSATPNILKRWSGSAWVKATPTTAAEVGATTSAYVDTAIATRQKTIPSQATAPSSPTSGDYWVDTSATPNVLKRYNGSAWVAAVPTTAADVGAIDNATLTAQLATKENSITKSNTAPTSPVTNQVWIDTSVSPAVWKRYTGSAWEKIVRTDLGELTGSISASQITTATLTTVGVDAAAIKTGTLDSNRIAANSIAANKILIGDYMSLAQVNEKLGAATNIPSGVFGGTIVNGLAEIAKAATANQYMMLSDYQANVFRTNDEVYYEFDIWTGAATTGLSFGVWAYNSSKGALGSNTAAITKSAAGWTKVTGSMKLTHTAFDTAALILVGIMDSNATKIDISLKNVEIMKKSAGQLIVDGSIQASMIASKVITAAQIATGTLTANELAANTITGNKIAAATITGSNVASNTITANNITIADFENYAVDGDFELQTAGAAPVNFTQSGGVGATVVSLATEGGGIKTGNGSNNALSIPAQNGSNQDVYGANYIPVEPNDEFFFKAIARYLNTAGTGGGRIGFLYYDANKVSLSNWTAAVSWGTTTKETTWTAKSGGLKVPAGAAFARIWISFQNNTENTNRFYIDNIDLRRRTNGNLIVDGSITASKILAGSITADKLNVKGLNVTDAGGATTFSISTNGDVSMKGAIYSERVLAGTSTSGRIESVDVSSGYIRLQTFDREGSTITQKTYNTLQGDSIHVGDNQKAMRVYGWGELVWDSAGTMASMKWDDVEIGLILDTNNFIVDSFLTMRGAIEFETNNAGQTGPAFGNGWYAIHLKNQDIRGANNIVFNDPLDANSEGITAPRTGKSGDSIAITDFDTLRILDGALYLDQAGVKSTIPFFDEGALRVSNGYFEMHSFSAGSYGSANKLQTWYNSNASQWNVGARRISDNTAIDVNFSVSGDLMSGGIVNATGTGTHVFGGSLNIGFQILSTGRSRIQFGTGTISVRNNADSAYVAVAASAFNVNSRREMKYDITDYETDALYQIETTPIREYHYITDLEYEKKRLGLILDESPADIVTPDGVGIDTYAMTTMSWKAIQQLSEKDKQKDEIIEQLLQRIAALEARA